MENVEMLKKLQDINSSVKVMFVQVNISDYSSIVKMVKHVVDQVGHVDVLINGAGVLADKDIETTVAVNLVTILLNFWTHFIGNFKKLLQNFLFL